MIQLRSAMASIQMHVGKQDANTDVFFLEARTPAHITVFDRFFHGSDLTKTLLSECKEIRAALDSQWVKDYKAAVANLQKCCPAWQSHKETLCQNTAVCAELLGNKEFPTLPVAIEELTQQNDLMKQLAADGRGHIVEKEILKTGKEEILNGAETVINTYA